RHDGSAFALHRTLEALGRPQFAVMGPVARTTQRLPVFKHAPIMMVDVRPFKLARCAPADFARRRDRLPAPNPVMHRRVPDFITTPNGVMDARHIGTALAALCVCNLGTPPMAAPPMRLAA